MNFIRNKIGWASQENKSARLRVKPASQYWTQIISEYFESIFQSFGKYVLPLCFGLNSVNRDNLIQNQTTEIAKKLFDFQDKSK